MTYCGRLEFLIDAAALFLLNAMAIAVLHEPRVDTERVELLPTIPRVVESTLLLIVERVHVMPCDKTLSTLNHDTFWKPENKSW